MRAGLKYLKFDTFKEANSVQGILHLLHMSTLITPDQLLYKAACIRYCKPRQPFGKPFWIIPVPDRIRFKRSLKKILNNKILGSTRVLSETSWTDTSEANL